jgi:hypothetical protein
MRVTDLIPWIAEQRHQPASRSARDPLAALQGNVNRVFDDFLRMFPIPLSGRPPCWWTIRTRPTWTSTR